MIPPIYVVLTQGQAPVLLTTREEAAEEAEILAMVLAQPVFVLDVAAVCWQAGSGVLWSARANVHAPEKPKVLQG